MAAQLLPGRWLWGFDLGRDLAAGAMIAGLVVTLACCVPAAARALAALAPKGPRALAILAAAVALGFALFAWTHADRALYTGDASLRHAAFAAIAHPEAFAQQSLRGDLVLHHSWPRWLAAHTPLSAEQAGRLQGACLALLTVLAAWRLARALGADGVVAVAAMIVAGCTGALALDNGYAKASVEVACLTTIAAVGVARAARDGRGLGTAGVAIGLALLLHRSALLLLPAWIACVALGWRFALAGPARQRVAALAGLLAPPVALALVLPRLVQVIGSFDTRHHVAPGGPGATLAFALSPAHLLDVVNTLVLLVPLAPLVPVLLAVTPRPERRGVLAFAAFALPPLALLVAINPQHGLSRDWDVYAFAGSALAAVAAWRIAAVVAAAPRARWIAVPLVALTLFPVLQWAALQSDAERMWSRAEAVLVGPPARPASERADGLGTIGMLRYGRGQFAAALRLFQRSAAAAPNPRTFVEWGMAETQLGHPDRALVQYRHAASLNPDLVTAWRGVAAAASALGDRARMAEAVQNLERLEPGDETAKQGRAWLEANPSPP